MTLNYSFSLSALSLFISCHNSKVFLQSQVHFYDKYGLSFNLPHVLPFTEHKEQWNSPADLLDTSHQVHVRLLGLSTVSCFLANKQIQCWGWSPGLVSTHLSAETSDVTCVKSAALFSAMSFPCDLSKVTHFEFLKRLQELKVQPQAEGTEAELQQQMNP